MILKEHKSHDGKCVIALCDDDILGKKFEENGLQLDLTSSFYKGEKKEEKEIKELFHKKKHFHLNAVGEACVEFCIKNDFTEKENIRKIKNIPYTNSIISRD